MAEELVQEALDQHACELSTEVARLRARVVDLEEDSRFLAALRAAGVDNWDGYSLASELEED